MGREPFVSNYSWLIGPGDHVQSDYTTPTVIKAWLQASGVKIREPDKQAAYGQWIAQLLQNQLGVPLVEMYSLKGQKQWPFTLRDDAIKALDDYFERKSH